MRLRIARYKNPVRPDSVQEKTRIPILRAQAFGTWEGLTLQRHRSTSAPEDAYKAQDDIKACALTSFSDARV
jgi:hypothetical protein